MRLSMGIGMALLNLVCHVTMTCAKEDSSLPTIVANDNRSPAGKLQNGILELHLELREGVWYPEDEGGGHRDVYGFAEEGKAPQSPGPLIRVPQGTQMHIRVRNTLALAAKIYGLHRHPGDPKDSLSLAPEETREVQFLAGNSGTYSYWGTTSDSSLAGRRGKETLLSGALVVDRPGAKAEDDRIFVLGVWEKAEKSGLELIPWINGKSWPHTEHLKYKIGQLVRWRVINTSYVVHGMHLHGFFFTVEGTGDGENYERYTEEQRRLGVTEAIDADHAFEMTWTPNRAGNWLFHCHMTGHMSVPEALHPQNPQPVGNPPEHGQMTGMGGMVMGITVLPGATSAPAAVVTEAPRKLQLVISENPDKVPLYKLELNDPQAPAEPGKKKQPLLGPLIVLTRGEATEIDVKNATSNPTAIHWHGIELESFYDGVPGWTGSGQQTTPPIVAGASFVARMTPPRAGTFIYHTHWHDETQLVNGMYGPLIVLEPGQKYDPENDKIFVIGTGRYAPFGTMLLVNGSPEPEPLELRTGKTYRLRLINITNNESDLRVRLDSKEVPAQWTVIAKDGADLPMTQRHAGTAEMGVTVGTTYDVEYRSERVGHVEMLVAAPSFEALIMQPLDFVSPK